MTRILMQICFQLQNIFQYELHGKKDRDCYDDFMMILLTIQRYDDGILINRR